VTGSFFREETEWIRGALFLVRQAVLCFEERIGFEVFDVQPARDQMQLPAEFGTHAWQLESGLRFALAGLVEAYCLGEGEAFLSGRFSRLQELLVLADLDGLDKTAPGASG